jgi:hypothetical protein
MNPRGQSHGFVLDGATLAGEGGGNPARTTNRHHMPFYQTIRSPRFDKMSLRSRAKILPPQPAISQTPNKKNAGLVVFFRV